MKIPKINVAYQIDKETEMFLMFLNNSDKIQRKIAIFKEHPILEREINNLGLRSLENQRIIIKNYLQKYQKKYKEKIEKIIKETNGTLLENSEKLLNNLAVLMDYTWRNNESNFLAIPTALPFCPFEKNTFYFSLIKYLDGGIKANHILFTAAHEISHFLLFRILAKYNIEIDKPQLQILQEIVAPVLMNQPSIVKITKHDPTEYFGNDNISLLYINYDNNTNKISAEFTKIFNEAKKNQGSFIDIIYKYIEILNKLKNDLKEKNYLWNINGYKVFENKNLLHDYTKPMKIK